MLKFAVFGNPIAHSISPRLHNLALKNLGCDAFYGRVLLEETENLKDKILSLGLRGVNITVPLKETAFQICDHLDTNAKNIGSVNTITNSFGKLTGYNTDAPGFLKAISKFSEIKSALVIGAGGTAKAISYALKSKNILVTVVNRSQKRKDGFKNYIYKTWEEFSPKGYDLVVNTTSAELVNNEYPMPLELLDQTLKNSLFVFDVIYNKPTNFINLAKKYKLEYKNGTDMLIWQAVLALNIFFDNKLNESQIYTAMNKAISLGA